MWDRLFGPFPAKPAYNYLNVFFIYPYAVTCYIQLRDRPQKGWNSARWLTLWSEIRYTGRPASYGPTAWLACSTGPTLNCTTVGTDITVAVHLHHSGSPLTSQWQFTYITVAVHLHHSGSPLTSQWQSTYTTVQVA